MGFRLTLPGGAIVESESAEDMAKLLAGLAGAPAAAGTARPSRGRGSVIPMGRGFYFKAWRDGKLHRGPTFRTREEADAAREAFVNGGPMPPKQPRRCETCSICDTPGHRRNACPTLPEDQRGPKPKLREPMPGRPLGCIEEHRGSGWRFVIQRGGDVTRSPIYRFRELAEAARAAWTEGKPFPPAGPRLRPGPSGRPTTEAILAHRAQLERDLQPSPAAEVVHYIGAPADGVPGLARCGADGEIRIIARRNKVTCPACLAALATTGEETVTETIRCGKCGAPGHNRRTCAQQDDIGPDVPGAERFVAALAPLEVKETSDAPRNFARSLVENRPDQEALAGVSTQRVVPETAQTDEEDDFAAHPQKVAHGVGRGRGVRHCKRCHQAGHITRSCDVDLTDARLQDIAAACVRIGLSPPPEPRAPMPVLSAAPPPATARPLWDRSDPDQDLTDLDLGAPELPPAPPVEEEPIVVTPPRPLALLEGEHDPTAAQARIRATLRVVPSNGRIRSKTLRGDGETAAGRLRRDEKAAAGDDLDPSAYDRPRTRGDCELGGKNESRPCPFVSCSMHLGIDVERNGSLKLNFPHLEVWEMRETCALDVADRNGITLEEVGELVNLTRERIRQLEVAAFERVKRRGKALELDELPDVRHSPLGEAIG